MFSKILVANRGEIAVRIIRACREMGIKTVAVYSEADSDALHTVLADERVCVGPAAAKDSYLNSKNIISAAVSTGVQAIHPGYGFLAENADFAKLCRDFGIVFIGPSSEVISRMGNKTNAIALMKSIGIPTVPGTGAVTSAEAVSAAKDIGYPLLVKAEAGGGGKGIRVVGRQEELVCAVETAAKEAEAAFGNANVYLEKYLTSVRHIEVQVLSDGTNVLTLGERDCTLQKNKQKVIEEAPSPVISSELREKMCESARLAAKAAGYVNAGTVEFLLDKSGNYYFIEMNTRLQVEHGVTEEMCGVDLVKWQIRVASLVPLDFSKKDIKISGSAIECRINAKSAGQVTFLHVPSAPGVRFDSALYSGCTVQAFYDSMIAKIITYAPNREEALRKMEAALCELIIEGIPTNIADQLKIIRNKDFINNNYDTDFLNKEIP